jgi:hypothetical protein
MERYNNRERAGIRSPALDARPLLCSGARLGSEEAAIHDVHARVPEPLLADARRQAPQLGVGALVRLAAARLAGWPEAAVMTVAGPGQDRGQEEG